MFIITIFMPLQRHGTTQYTEKLGAHTSFYE